MIILYPMIFVLSLWDGVFTWVHRNIEAVPWAVWLLNKGAFRLYGASGGPGLPWWPV